MVIVVTVLKIVPGNRCEFDSHSPRLKENITGVAQMARGACLRNKMLSVRV